MSILELKPEQVPVELKVRIERVMSTEGKTWYDALLFLARGVVSPNADAK